MTNEIHDPAERASIVVKATSVVEVEGALDILTSAGQGPAQAASINHGEASATTVRISQVGTSVRDLVQAAKASGLTVIE